MKCDNSIPNPKIPDVEEPNVHGIFFEIWKNINTLELEYCIRYERYEN